MSAVSQPKALTIVIEFEGGARREAALETLPETLQLELLRQPFASSPSPHPEQEKFLLLEWDDGWKEVFELDGACTGVKRYTVISRPEDVGRLAIDRGDGYPELIEVVRKPLNVSRVTLLVDSVDTVRPTRDRSTREGKKTDHFYKLAKEGDARADLVGAFKNAASAEGLDLGALRSGDPARSREQYERIRRRMGIRAGQRQQDVWDFMAYLASASVEVA
ncbi:MAG: hypothetical protein HY657_10605 [Acidobacteria bacterium]|nr:hypothetical protein [Acidobacteriota bacterium]